MFMKNRFASKKRGFGVLKEILMPVLIFGVVGGMFYFGLNSVGQTSESERLRSVEKAVSRATVQCYAVEGRYPSSLAYLEERYGLIIDHEKYIVQYDIFASNLMPTILVLPMDFQEGSEAGGFEDEDGF